MSDSEVLQPFSDREWKEMRAYVNGKNTVVPKWIEQDPGRQFKRMSAYLDALREPVDQPETATEMPMDNCGLTINVGRDGTWLHFTAKSGKSAGINVENWANFKDGGITAQALRDWASDRREQAAAIGGSRG